MSKMAELGGVVVSDEGGKEAFVGGRDAGASRIALSSCDGQVQLYIHVILVICSCALASYR
jgi:hypothetical protein